MKRDATRRGPTVPAVGEVDFGSVDRVTPI